MLSKRETNTTKAGGGPSDHIEDSVGCTLPHETNRMPHDDTPKTRTELKRSGKKDKGPYSAKHVRAAEALAERRAAAPKPSAPAGPKKK